MRTLTTTAALLLASVFAAGCSDQTAPTELSEGELGPQFNQAPDNFPDPFSFPELNPCTGVDHTIFVVANVKEHFFGNGRNFHVNVVVHFDVTSSDGFSGSAVEHFTLEEGTTVTVTDGVNTNLSNDSGQRIHLNAQFHLTISNGVVRAVVDNVSLRCVGKPAA